MRIDVHTKNSTYPIYFEHHALARAKELIGECGVPYLISDDGVPEKWRKMLQEQFPDSKMFVFPNGEKSKNFDTYKAILEDMLKHHVSRKDTVIALGGGVVGDMSGFAAASYMRGIRYINIPTTTLSQIDSSIGGKTAIDLGGIKNCVGAFWQPSMVLVDPEVLSTLDLRQLNNGLAEAVKEGLIRDPELFALFESEDYLAHVDEIILRSLEVKRIVVEHDEREMGERKLLNFGHTYGHAYETYYEFKYLHGECVAIGMMKILKNKEIKTRLEKVLNRLNLPCKVDADLEKIANLVKSDKKADHKAITIVQVDEIGVGHLEDWTQEDIRRGLGL